MGKVRTHVSIEEEHKEWAEEECINLSALLRKAIERRKD